MSIFCFICRVAITVLFIGAGVFHFTHHELFTRMVPPLIPHPGALVLLTGVFELLWAPVMFLVRSGPAARRVQICTVAYLLAVFPANVYMALHPELFPEFSPGGLRSRIPGQALLLAIAWLGVAPTEKQPPTSTDSGRIDSD